MVDMTPELLAQMLPEPFLTAEAGDTVIIFMSGTWTLEQVNSMGTYLEEWAPQIEWRAIHDPGFAGIIHIKATADAAPDTNG